MTNFLARKKSLYIFIVFIIMMPVICSVILPIINQSNKYFNQTPDYKQLKYNHSFTPEKSNGYFIVLPSYSFYTGISELKSIGRNVFHWKGVILNYTLSALMSRSLALVLCFLYFLALLTGDVSVIAFPIGGHAPPKGC